MTWAERMRSRQCPSISRSGKARLERRLRRYPLQAIAHHYMARVHSTHANNDWLVEAFPQRAFINPLDAEPRGIADGDLVRVFNDRGETGAALPGHAAHPAGRGGHPAGGVVAAGRKGRGPGWLGERAELKPLDAVRFWHGPADDAGAGGEGLR